MWAIVLWAALTVVALVGALVIVGVVLIIRAVYKALGG